MTGGAHMLKAVEKEIILAFIRQNPRKLADFLEREDAETFGDLSMEA
jgi:hypothetical protein